MLIETVSHLQKVLDWMKSWTYLTQELYDSTIRGVKGELAH